LEADCKPVYLIKQISLTVSLFTSGILNDSQDNKRIDNKEFVMLVDLSMKMVDSLKESSTNVNELSSWFSEVEPLNLINYGEILP
jgi:hypothetical protein